MKHPVLDIFRDLRSVKDLTDAIKLGDRRKISISPLTGSTKTLLVSSITGFEKHLLILLPSARILNEMKVELNIVGLGDQTVCFEELTQEVVQEKLTDLNKREKFILLSTYDLLKVALPSKDDIDKNTTLVQAGGELTYDELVEYLNLLNYQQERYVEDPGDFAIRGSIIDFWSYSEKYPCRLEFDGDFLESIRYFDAESQRSSTRVEQVTLAAQISAENNNLTSTIFDYLDNPLTFASYFELNNFFKKKKKTIEPGKVEDEIEVALEEDIIADEEKQVVRNEDSTQDVKVNGDLKLEELLEKDIRWLIEEEIEKSEDRIQLHFTPPPIINSNFELLYKHLSDFSLKGFEIIITAENELQAKRLVELLSDFKNELRDLIESEKIKIISLAIKSGFVSKKEKLLIISDYEIFNKPYRTKISSKKKYKRSRAKDFASIKRGDFVVHENYGIGQYAGLETIKIGQVDQESIKILYAEGGVVYVNLNYLALVKKYSSKENAQPRLSVLGSNEWKTTKRKVKAKIKDAARELIQLYARRKAATGITYSPDSIWQKELEASFFYEDTPDQSKVTDEVKGDMESSNPMDRLVCGDVGFGKTEVAVRAAFKAVNDGKQVVILAPTTILTEQHYNTFKDRLSHFPVKVASLSRFSTKAQQESTVKNLSDGRVDIVIGTHRLLSKDIKIKDLGLLIIDEEHRFGVMAKEKLRSLKANVDTLTLTATPIPRTLNLSLLGARDLSLIATPPPNRQPIYTKVDKFDIVKIREWVMNEISRNGQIYFVHDRVQSIDKIAAYLNKHIPELNIAVAHGQMKPSQLEKVIYDFLNRKYHMLVSTKIIESGLDIPNVNTIIVNRADRFGLAELHQLRGRVGRSDRQAYAFLLVPSFNTITKKAVRRLQAIEEYTDLGEGFSISMRDLEIRGAGNLLGTEQSGFIDTVGFELYLKFVDEAVIDLKQNEFQEAFKDLPVLHERTEPTIDAYFEIGIPKSFMSDQADRLSFYTALFSMTRIEEVDEIKEEMEDRFGKLPVLVERIILTAILRYYASYAMLERVIIQRKKIIMILPKQDREDYYKNKFKNVIQLVMDKYPNKIYFKQVNETMKLELDNPYDSIEKSLNAMIAYCKEIMDVVTSSTN